MGVQTGVALSKWHAIRAAKGRQLTLSFGMIAPLRRDLYTLRGAVSVALRRPVSWPRPWYPATSARSPR